METIIIERRQTDRQITLHNLEHLLQGDTAPTSHRLKERVTALIAKNYRNNYTSFEYYVQSGSSTVLMIMLVTSK